MQIDFRAPGAWSSLNEKMAEQLGLNLDKTVARVYQGVGHALLEVMWGLAKIFPQRKKIYYFKNMDPTFDLALIPFAKEGYQLVPLEFSVLLDFNDFVSGLVGGSVGGSSPGKVGGSPREDLLVLYSVDDPLLGRAYDVAKFEEAIKSTGVFKVRISHARHFYEGGNFAGVAAPGVAMHGGGALTLDRNWAYIYSLSPYQALALLGERGKIGSLTADQLQLDESAWSKLNLDWFYKPQVLNRHGILSFEASGVADARAFFSPSDLRVADRAVIYWTDMDGHAVIDRLAQRLGFTLNPPGQESRLETTSLSRWGGVRTMDFFKTQMTEVLRGLVMISHELIESNLELFESHLREVRKSILQDQNG